MRHVVIGAGPSGVVAAETLRKLDPAPPERRYSWEEEPEIDEVADDGRLGIDPARCLAAGDTLNDLSMLECGLPAVAVGGAEPPLLEKIRCLDHVHEAEAIGAAGIVEAIRKFGLHPDI